MKKCCVWQWRAHNISWSTLVLSTRCAHIMCSLTSHVYQFENYFFFLSQKCVPLIFHPYSRTVPNSFTFCPRLFIIKSHHGKWWLAMKFLFSLSQEPADTFASPWLCSALSRPQAFFQDRSIWAITCVVVQLLGSAWRSQGYRGRRLVVPEIEIA